jgi:phage tail sheath protein FI
VAARSWIGRKVERLGAALLAPFLIPLALFGALAAFLASRMAAVGVVVNTGARPGSTTSARSTGADYFVAGLTERGSTTDPVEVRSMAEYEEKLGGRVTYGYLYDDLTTFFAEGGERAYVARVVGAAATRGTRTLVDRAGVPANTIVLTANNAGAWSANLDVEVIDGNLADTFTLRLYLDDELVETYYDLASPQAAVDAINGSSTLVTAANSGSATVAPDNNPAVIAATAFSAGTDDRASVVAADYVTALARFGPEYGAGAVAIPGFPSSSVGAGLIAHADTSERRIALLAVAAGATNAAVKAAATALRSTVGSEHAGIFHRWVQVPDGSGGLRTISPEGYIAGVRARAIREEGPWRAPAGEIAVARYVRGTEGVALTAADVNDLADARVNPVRTMNGGVRLYGWRSLSTDTNYKLLTARDTLNVVAERAEEAMEQFVHAPVDGAGRLFSAMEAELTAILDPMRASGGIYELLDDDGQQIDAGYIIDTGPSVNTPAVLAANEVRANIALRISPAAELVTLTITKVAHDAALS